MSGPSEAAIWLPRVFARPAGADENDLRNGVDCLSSHAMRA